MSTLTVQIPRAASGAQRQAIQLRLAQALARRHPGAGADRVVIRDIPPYAWGDAAEPRAQPFFQQGDAS